MKIKTLIAAAVVAFSPITLSATTVTIGIESFGSLGNNDRDRDAALAAMNSFIGSAPRIITEDFSTFKACPGAGCAVNPQTKVGNFTVIGSGGSGGSVVPVQNNVVVRSAGPNGNVFGRYGVLGTRTHWLDSNDNPGIHWTIPGASGLSNIVRLAFFLTDVQDVTDFQFEIDVSGGLEAQNTGPLFPGKRPNGELLLVTMSFTQSVDDLNIRLLSGTGLINDGFGISGVSVAAVPLPAGGLLLISALGGMAVLRRRQKARDALSA